MQSFRRAKNRPAKPASISLSFEQLQDRIVPATFVVNNLNDAGLGSLRQAILDANATAGLDNINFDVAGTISLTSGTLAALTDTVVIDGATAPGFGGAPVVEIDYSGFSGLRFAAGANGSSLLSLGHVNAAGAGVTLEGRAVLVAGNYIGLSLDGSTVAANGQGIQLTAAAADNLIGGTGANAQNLISGNTGAGIAILGGVRNRIVNNLIGTDFTGGNNRGNGGDGIYLGNKAGSNKIGGVTPIAGGAAKPPEGNVISGNGGNGVLIAGGSRFNNLSGNFIGVDLTGVFDLGNGLDGVAIIEGSNDNQLVGTFRNDAPFIFFNVLGGNGGNGLRIHNSNRTIVHANYFGLGADDAADVGNTLNGVLVEGTSSDTQFGGVIPLGNVTACNDLNGILVQDQAKNFFSDNTFSGVGSFTPNDLLGNGQDGIRITSSGTGIVIRTSVISSNGDDGIEVSGSARGVRIVQCIIGLNTDAASALGNHDNGIEVGGFAKGTLIGGAETTFSIAPRNIISANEGYGIAVLANARDTQINFSNIGTGAGGNETLGNFLGGVFIGDASRNTTVGSRVPGLKTIISGNFGPGILIQGGGGNSVIGCYIGLNADGRTPLGNLGSGILIENSSGNRIGGSATGEGNVIAFNAGHGVRIDSGSKNGIRRNSIYLNESGGIFLEPLANGGIIAPTITSAVSAPGNVRVAGTIEGRKNHWYTIDVFVSFDDNPGTPEGFQYIATVMVKTNSRGQANWAVRAFSPPPGAQLYTATATDADKNTSIFSNGLIAIG